MESLVCFPGPLPTELHKALDACGYAWVVVDDAQAASELEPAEGWMGAVVSAIDSLDEALGFARALKGRESPVSPLLVVIAPSQLPGLQGHRELFDDFSLEAVAPDELEARLGHLLWRSGRGRQSQVISYGPLALNLETYQAVVSGRPLDLTYMEYELLRFLAAHPGKVFTREALLAQVWGYEYFGGARTVDVHIRRLRAKLGEENARLIETVRSVGYRFGTARWHP